MKFFTYTLSAILLVYACESVPPPPKGQTALGLECFEVAGKWYDGNGDQIEAEECEVKQRSGVIRGDFNGNF